MPIRIPATRLRHDRHNIDRHGSITFQTNGGYTYHAECDYGGTDSVDYTVRDASGLSDTGTLTIAVKAVNDGPGTVSLADITQQGPRRRLAMRCKRRSTITIRTALRAA